MRGFNRRNKKSTIVLGLIALILCISLGYAYLTSNLSINGFSKLFNSSWSIHFDNIQEMSGNVELEQTDKGATITPEDDTEVTYAVTLKNPGDKYEFTVDVVNDGTIDGMVDLVASKLKIGDGEYVDISSESLPSYIDYSVTYVDGAPIKKSEALKAGETDTYKVKVEFKKDIEASDLPDSDTTVEFDLKPDYKQADEKIKDRIPYTNCTYEGELVQGAEYTNGQFTYKYMQQSTYSGWVDMTEDGWGVTLTDKDSTDPVSTKMCNVINNKPVVSASNMFNNSKTASIDTSKINTSTITKMNGMFENVLLEELDVSGFDTSNVTNMRTMFYGVSNIEELDLSNWDTSNVTDMMTMFSNATSLKNIKIGNWDTSKVTTMSAMFANAKSLKSIDLSNWDTSNVADFSSMFTSCISLKNVDLSNFDLSKANNMQTVFSYTTKLENVILDDWDLSNWSAASIGGGFFAGSTVKNVSCKNWKLPNDFSHWIARIWAGSSVESIDVTDWKLSNTTNVSGLFGNAINLKTIIGLDTWDTSSITNMSEMFLSCSSLTKINLDSFNTSNVTNMNSMFNSCTNLKSIYASSSFDTSVVSNSSNMFSNDTNLVGGNGTVYDSNHVDKAYAHLDAGVSNPGYFSSLGSIKITFNSNGGNPSTIVNYYDENDTLGNLYVPIKSGFIFMGWYTALDGGNKINENDIVTESKTYYAHWKESIQMSEHSWEEIVEAVEDGNEDQFIVGDEKEVDLGELGVHKLRVANTSTPDECSTNGFSQTACGFVLEFTDIITTHSINSVATNEGSWNESDIREFINSEIYTKLPQVLKNAISPTYVVSGHNETQPENFIAADNMYLLSKKEVWGVDTYNMDTSSDYSRQLDYYRLNGVTAIDNGSYAIKMYNNSASYWWLRSPSRRNGTDWTAIPYAGYDTGGDPYTTTAYGVSPALKLKNSSSNSKYSVYLNSNGGKSNITYKVINRGSNIGTLPIPTRDGYVFAGWFTGIESGEEVTSSYIPTDNMELFARWR